MKIVLSEKQLKNIIKNHISENNLDELNYQSLQDDENLQDLRDAIDKNKLVSVAFVKKDGSVKHMLIRKSLSSYVGSEREKTDAQMNVEANNDLKKVVDVNAYKREIKTLRIENPGMEDMTIKQMAAKKAWRSINLRNVLGFMVGGRFIDLRDENEIMDRYGEQVHGQLTKSMIASMAPVENNPEGEINEINPITGWFKNLGSGIRIAKNQTNFFRDLKFINTQSKNLMSKFGVVINTAKVRQLTEPLYDTLPIIAHEFNNLQGKLNPNFNLGYQLKNQFETIQKTIKVPEGSTLNLSYAYREAELLKQYAQTIRTEKMVTPAGMAVLKRAEAQVSKFLQEIETALSYIAVAK
jgi:hypothetical protein